MSNEPRLFRIKVVILGDGAVGKRSIIYRYLDGSFEHKYYATIDADVYIKRVELVLEGIKYPIEWNIWKFAGTRHREIFRGFYLGAHGALIVFDITRRDTLNSVVYWAEEFIKYAGAKKPIVLVGNKKDLRQVFDDCISKEEGEEMAKKLSEMIGEPVKYIEISAMTKENINEPFEEIGKKLY